MVSPTAVAIEAARYICDRSDPPAGVREALESDGGLRRVHDVCAARAHDLLSSPTDQQWETASALLRVHAIAIEWAQDIVESAGYTMSLREADLPAGEALVALLTWRLTEGFFPAQRLVGLCCAHIRAFAAWRAPAGNQGR